MDSFSCESRKKSGSCGVYDVADSPAEKRGLEIVKVSTIRNVLPKLGWPLLPSTASGFFISFTKCETGVFQPALCKHDLRQMLFQITCGRPQYSPSFV